MTYTPARAITYIKSHIHSAINGECFRHAQERCPLCNWHTVWSWTRPGETVEWPIEDGYEYCHYACINEACTYLNTGHRVKHISPDCPKCGSKIFIKIGRYRDGSCKVHCMDCGHEASLTNEEYYGFA